MRKAEQKSPKALSFSTSNQNPKPNIGIKITPEPENQTWITGLETQIKLKNKTNCLKNKAININSFPFLIGNIKFKHLNYKKKTRMTF